MRKSRHFTFRKTTSAGPFEMNPEILILNNNYDTYFLQVLDKLSIKLLQKHF